MSRSLVGARALLLLAFSFVVAVAPASAQVVIRGFLYNDGTGERLTGTVMLVDPDTDVPVVTATTDSLGQFALQVQHGTFRLAAIHPGYKSILSAPMAYQNGERLTVRIPIAETGDPKHNIGVLEHVLPRTETRAAATSASSARLDAFERRRRLGQGLAFNHDDLVKSQARTVGEFLQNVQGFHVNNPASTSSMSITRNGAAASSALVGTAACHVAWFLDGQRMDVLGRIDPTTDALGNTSIDAVEAVEVFRGISELPPEFSDPDVRCGAVALWTRL